MKHRYTIEQLAMPNEIDYFSDIKMLSIIVMNAKNDINNEESLLRIRLDELYTKLHLLVNAGITNLPKLQQ